MISGIDKYFVDVVIERSIATQDAWGNTVQSWATLSTIKGLLRQLNGDEVVVGEKDSAISTHRMYCRNTDITTNDRVLYGGIYYEVKRVNNVMNFNELLQVDCDVY